MFIVVSDRVICPPHTRTSPKLAFPSCLWVAIQWSRGFSPLFQLNLKVTLSFPSTPLWSQQVEGWLYWARLRPVVPDLKAPAGKRGAPVALWSEGLAGHRPCSPEPSSACPETRPFRDSYWAWAESWLCLSAVMIGPPDLKSLLPPVWLQETRCLWKRSSGLYLFPHKDRDQFLTVSLLSQQKSSI